ncbi:MAG: hypothetical protein ABJN28_07895, partial [Flavobacteriaceae bacterium]
MKTSTKLILPLLSMFILSCSSDSESDVLPPDDDDGGIVENGITYTADIRPIITSNCVGCHANPPTNGAPFSLTTFQDVSNRANSVFTRTNNGTMPPSRKLP